MEKIIVDAWELGKDSLRQHFANHHPENYKDVVSSVVAMLHANIDDYKKPDPKRIHEIDDGHYQGTLVYVIGATGYQPSDYWYVRVYYGSCSGCDTLEYIQCGARDKPSDDQVSEYMTLALHIIQNMRSMSGDIA